MHRPYQREADVKDFGAAGAVLQPQPRERQALCHDVGCDGHQAPTGSEDCNQVGMNQIEWWGMKGTKR
jgi:hypothetical protein